MGKGIEDISHFFISTETPSVSEKETPRDVPMGSFSTEHHRIMGVFSHTPGVPGIVWTSQLARALSQMGKKVLLIDIGSDSETLASALKPVVVRSSLSEFLEVEVADKAISHTSSNGFQVLSFQIQSGEMELFEPEEREILFQVLCREERLADAVMVNIHFDLMNEEIFPSLKLFHEAAMVVSPYDIKGAYSMLKAIYHLKPDLRVGLIESEPCRNRKNQTTHRLIEASGRFLKKSPMELGNFPASVSGENSTNLKDGLNFFNLKKDIKDIMGLGEKLWHDLKGQEDRHLFFERILSNLAGTSC